MMGQKRTRMLLDFPPAQSYSSTQLKDLNSSLDTPTSNIKIRRKEILQLPLGSVSRYISRKKMTLRSKTNNMSYYRSTRVSLDDVVNSILPIADMGVRRVP